MEQKFSEFEKSSKYEIGLIWSCLCYLCLPGTAVEPWFIIQEVVGSNTIFYKKHYTEFCRFYRIYLGTRKSWTQDAYRPLRSKYMLYCSLPGGTLSGWGHTPIFRGGLPLFLDRGYPGISPLGWMGYLPPPIWTGRQTDTCQNITFPRTSYAGDKK